jgi:cytochrome b involved in lipid metabolism
MAAELPVYTAEDVAKHNTESDCWVIYRGGVYAFPEDFILSVHPGGAVLLDAAGKDGTILFDDGPHGDSAREELLNFRIGTLKKQE